LVNVTNVLTQVNEVESMSVANCSVCDGNASPMSLFQIDGQLMDSPQLHHSTQVDGPAASSGDTDLYESGLNKLQLSGSIQKTPADSQKLTVPTKLTPACSLTLIEAVRNGLTDSTTGLYEDPYTGRRMPLREALELNLLSADNLIVVDTAANEILCLDEAYQRGIVDAALQTVQDTKSGRQLTFTNAVMEGIVREDDACPTLSELAADGRYDASSGTVLNPKTGLRIGLLEAIENGLVDRKSVRLRDPATGQNMTLAEAVERGIMDPDTGDIVDSYTGSTMRLIDAVNYGVLGLSADADAKKLVVSSREGQSSTESDRMMGQSQEQEKLYADKQEVSKSYTILEAIQQKMFDPRTNTFKDPLTGETMTFEAAVDCGLIDTSRAMVQDPRTGQKVSFDVLVEMGLIDLNRGIVRDSQGHDISLADAAMDGLLFENPPVTGPMSLRRLVDEGLCKLETGEFLDLSSRQLISLGEAIRISLLDPQSVVVTDPGSREVLGMLDAIRIGIIDTETSRVRDTASRETVSLGEALDRGVLINKPLSISAAVDIGLFNEATGKFLDPTCRRFFYF
jgi:hypothetical protein